MWGFKSPLAHQTRHEIFRYIADASRPVDVAELTSHLGLDHNAIRQHLAKLVHAGLVVEDHAPRTGRGASTVRTRGDRVEVVLGNCPFATAALVDPATLCSMHLGIAQGVADLTGGRVVVDELVPHDPRRAKCRLRLHLEPDDRS